MPAGVFATDNVISSGFDYNDYSSEFSNIGTVPSLTSSYTLTYSVNSNKPKYIYFTWGAQITKIEIYRSIKGLSEVLNNLDSLQQQGNQLQQQQNQIQQEQNNFLKQEQSDSDVSVDGFNSVDANDITSDGLTGVFTNIYNKVTSWSSKDIIFPIPFTGSNIFIPADYTRIMLNAFGGSWIITFISSIYYFIVARFIIYSITGIVNSIKSGSILETDSKNNITTDML